MLPAPWLGGGHGAAARSEVSSLEGDLPEVGLSKDERKHRAVQRALELDDEARYLEWLAATHRRGDPELEMRPGTRMWLAQLRMLRHDLDMLRQAREREEARQQN